MKYIFQLNHPAHYHLFKNAIKSLKERNHDVLIIARGKDVLESLIKSENYVMIKTKKGKYLWQKLKLMKCAEKEILSIAKSFNPDIVIGTGAFSYISKKLGIPTFFWAEDDLNLNLPIFLVGLLCYHNFTELFAPTVCYNSLWDKRTIKYDGYHELTYLHPNNFTPLRDIVEKYFSSRKPYFILRFVQLNAYHDIGIKGINTEIAERLIEILQPYGDIYITSERKLEPQFEQFRIRINPLHIHHILAFATLYIGDSQSMALEAGVLGTPSIRFSSFVGKISVLEELEHKYNLTYGIKTDSPEKLYYKIQELLAIKELKEMFMARRDKMLKDKIDVNAFMIWFIENYPESKRIMKENPDYQYKFK